MKKIEATYRITTPMFLAGANQQKAELRVPSIKGALRFWWRALAWNKHEDLENLQAAEANLFGSSDQKVGQSNLILSLKPADLNTTPAGKLSGYGSPALKYIGFGLFGQTDSPERSCLLPDQVFTLNCILNKVDDVDLDLLRDAFVSLGLFGGLGSRSRKGWGSMTLIKFADGTKDDFSSYRGGEEVFLDIRRLKEKYTHAQGLPPFSAFSKLTRLYPSKKHEIKLYSSAKKALTALSNKYQAFVGGAGRKGSDFKLWQRAEFGLPREGPKSDKGIDTRVSTKRRSSPLLFNIVETMDKKAIICASYLQAEFSDKKQYRRLKQENQKAEQFLNELSEKGAR